MSLQKLAYQLSNGTVSGHIANRPIHFTVRPTQAGSSPPPGNYMIHPPVNDPVYGWLAYMTPDTGSGPGAARSQKITGASNSVKLPGASAKEFIISKPNRDSPVFVLTSRPITGQNCLIISTGFADLIDALHVSGGSSVVVA